MAYNTKAIKTDVDSRPIPQVYSPATDEYEVLKGDAGAARQVLYDKDGNVVSVVSGKLAVRAAEIEDALATLLTKAGFDAKADVTLSALRDALRGTGSKTLSDLAAALGTLNGKDFATQTTQSAILSKLSADPATQTTLAAILAKIITAPSTEAKQDALNALIGEVQASPTANTLLARIKSLEDKLAAIIAGTSPASVQLSGSNEVQVNSSALPTGASTEATLALIKAKTDNIPSDPSKESGKLTALETLITTLNEKIDTLDAVIDSIKDTDGIKKITDTVDVQLSGSNVNISGKTYAVSGGDTIRGKAADKPTAPAAHAVIPYCYHFSIDTGTVEATDGTNWVVI